MKNLIAILSLITLANCASIGGMRGDVAKVNLREGQTCIDYDRDELKFGVALAKELELRFSEDNQHVPLVSEFKKTCDKTIKLQPTVFLPRGRLGDVFVSVDDKNDNRLLQFKLENSARNCCNKNPEAASKMIFQELVK